VEEGLGGVVTGKTFGRRRRYIGCISVRVVALKVLHMGDIQFVQEDLTRRFRQAIEITSGDSKPSRCLVLIDIKQVSVFKNSK
jgi:hypothetical protein